MRKRIDGQGNILDYDGRIMPQVLIDWGPDWEYDHFGNSLDVWWGLRSISQVREGERIYRKRLTVWFVGWRIQWRYSAFTERAPLT